MDQQQAVVISKEPNHRPRHHRHLLVNTIQLRPVNMKPASPVMIDQQQIDQLGRQQNSESNIPTVMMTKFANKKVLRLNSIDTDCTLCSTLSYTTQKKHKIFSIPV